MIRTSLQLTKTNLMVAYLGDANCIIFMWEYHLETLNRIGFLVDSLDKLISYGI